MPGGGGGRRSGSGALLSVSVCEGGEERVAVLSENLPVKPLFSVSVRQRIWLNTGGSSNFPLPSLREHV